MDWASTSSPTNNAFPFSWFSSANDRLQVFWNVVSGRWETRRVAAGVPGVQAFVTDSFNAGDFRTIVLAWTSTTVGISVNGAAFTSVVNGNVSSALPALFDIGTAGDGTVSQIDSDILWFACGIGTLSNADAGTINSLGNADPTRVSFPSTAQVTMTWDGTSTTGSLK